MNQPTVAAYAVSRIAQLGIDRVFGVPGDYAFPIDDAVEAAPNVQWVACANELNAAYAADGYARIRGAAMLSTTYGVGELSALNGVMGSRAHRLPVFHLVGMPSQRTQHLGLITHHNVGDTRYDRFQALSGAAACVTAELNPDNCIEELERVIREALRQSMPAYIVISDVHGRMPVIGNPEQGVPLAQIKRQRSDPRELTAAVAAIMAKLTAATDPVALVTTITSRYGVADKATELIAKANLPVAITAFDKGVIDESLPQFIGQYGAAASMPPTVSEAVLQADLILDVGGLVLAELNTGFWSDAIDKGRAVCIHENWVRSGSSVFLNVAIDDVLDALIAEVSPRAGDIAEAMAPLPLVGAGDEPTCSANFYPRLQRKLAPGDTLVIETGTAMTHLNAMRLPAGVGAEGQGLWGSIGWATPAALGIALAKTSGRTWLVTGDGAHQLTLNELAVMGRYGIAPVIFVLNNGLYGIEDAISGQGHDYDELAPVKYHLLPAAFGCRGWLTSRVSTVAELERALEALDSHDGAAYIEVMIPHEESQPLPADLIDRGYKLATPPSQ
ncbi:alpha-keto acid decarboxylase family protein [Mycolicibacter arupensis]|uniref:Alpha-keto-acid decarboxylase n=1 Tax=Mycolicibacter arupensis TaxID=342002 RepID=A0A5C7YD24_9MYCO|nr:thiamine pyrophosphate-binding protein [Mycolicibacter arupensis]TXI59461.1 MAG: alpha-keto acid decarboxylase family protein [Mycolicibacter arupensis]